MKEKTSPRAALTAVAFLLIVGGFFLLNCVITPPEILKSERRKPTEMPYLSLESLVSGKFMSDFEGFAADNFTFREEMRSLKSFTIFNLSIQKDKSGLYYGQSGAGKFEMINESEYRRSAAKIRMMSEKLTELNLYYAIIPDKSIYAGFDMPGFDMPGFDLKQAESILADELPGITYINIASSLTGEDFYRSDLHWDQSRLQNVIDTLSEKMGFTSAINWVEKTAGEFQGVYAGQLALPISSDRMTYCVPENKQEKSLTAEYLTGAGIFETGPVYDHEAFMGNDPYDLFLRGSQPLIRLSAPEVATTGKTLYLFRDSFSSSLAPLLAFNGGYSEVVLIDLRYIDSRVLDQFVTFKEGSDVLFLYSSQILNNSSVLKVSASN